MTGLSVILTFSVNLAGFSVIAAVASHAAFKRYRVGWRDCSPALSRARRFRWLRCLR